MKALLIATLAAALVAAPAKADEPGSIGELLTQCKSLIKFTDTESVSMADVTLAGVCSGYLSGYNDVASMRRGEIVAGKVVMKEDSHWGICTPPTASPAQLARVFVKWAEENPQRLHLPRLLGAQEAFKGAWPCPNR